MDSTPRLSILELNRIAGEFGIQFMVDVTDETPSVSLSSGHTLYAVGPMLADKCEAEGSRWCEPLRSAVAARHFAFVVPMDGYTLTDWQDAKELQFRNDPPEFDVFGG